MATGAMENLRAPACTSADAHRLPRDVFGALLALESAGGTARLGDNGHGHGLVQIDDRYHADLLGSPAPDGSGRTIGAYIESPDGDGWCIEWAATFLADKIAQWAATGYGGYTGLWAGVAAYNGDDTGANNYVPNVRARLADYADWLTDPTRVPPGVPAGGGIVSTTTKVPADAVVAATLKHLGEAWFTDARNGTKPVHLWCLANVQDWYLDAGVTIPSYTSARALADSVTLSQATPVPVGAAVIMEGPGWSEDDHIGIHIGAGRVVSALNTVVISTGWLDLPSFRGWWLPESVGDVTPPAPAPPQTQWFIDGNPYGQVPIAEPFWSRWDALNTQGVALDHPGVVNPQGLAMPHMGYAVKAEFTVDGRRIQEWERGVYGTQDAPAPWDVVQLLPGEVDALKAKGLVS